MSKTFTSRPSVNKPSRGRGASTRNSGRVLSEESSSLQPSSSRGRGAQGGGPITRSRSTSSSKKMYARETQGAVRQPVGETPQPTAQQGEYCGGFTVFQPNVRKRQQINEMAQRETAAYERFKEERKPRNLNYVGTAGGDTPEQSVRNRQHLDNRFQKVKRQQRQEEVRLAKKEAEDRKIEAMRKEARRKAEENELSGKMADPEDLRRRREAFLQRIENQGRE